MFRPILLAALIACVPSASLAGTLSLTFDLSASTFAVLQPTEVPTETREATGRVVLTLTGVDPNGVPLGPDASGSLAGFMLSATFGNPFEGGTIVGRRLDFMQTQLASGGFDGSQLVLDTGLAGSGLSSPVCTAPICLTITLLGPFSFSFDTGSGVAIGLSQLDPPGAAMLAATFGFQNPVLALQLRGTEVARSFVSEPATASLLALALTVLGGAAALRRRRA